MLNSKGKGKFNFFLDDLKSNFDDLKSKFIKLEPHLDISRKFKLSGRLINAKW